MRPWLPVCALLALGCASDPPRTDAGTDTPAPLDGGTDVTPPEDRPAALDVVAVDMPDVSPTEIAPMVDVVDVGGGEDAPDAVAVADVPAMDAPDVVTADTPDVAVAVADVVDAGPVCDAMLDSDYTNCGACGVVCGDRPNAVGVCRAGACTTACRSNFADCDGDPSNGCETSIINNASNCGMCGRVCGTGQECSFTTCRCPAPQSLCGGRCAETNIDPNNCGMCGRSCVIPNTITNCRVGLCSFMGCEPNFDNCDRDTSNGCESDRRTDPANCGVCGNACGSSQSCVGGVCACSAGLTACGRECVDTRTSTTNCGGCGVQCSTVGATPQCRSGVCAIERCTSSVILDCDGNASNGCETDIRDNSRHCGACGVACPTGYGCARAMCYLL